MAEQPTLASLLERLESATDRLETIALASAANPSTVQSSIAKNTESVLATVPASVESFDQLLQGSLKSYLDLSEEIGDPVKEQSLALAQLFQAQRLFILMAAQSQRPDYHSSEFAELLGPTKQLMEKVSGFLADNRSSPLFNHLSVVSEGSSALGWITVEPAPAPYISEMKDCAQFYANRVLKEYKEKEPKHAVWVKAFITVLADLQTYVKTFHTTGLVWNPKGGDAREIAGEWRMHALYFSSDSSLASPSSSGKRPRPPVPPRHDRVSPVASTPAAQPDRSALFSALNRGEGITSGLRKVDKSEMTHKNPELRAGSTVAEKTGAASAPGTLPATWRGDGGETAAVKKTPRTALEGRKWIVEYHESGQVILDGVERDHAVYIFQCSNCTITIKDKANAVTIDKCRKIGIVLDSVVSNVEVIRGDSIQLQVLGQVPTMTVDSTDSAQIFLSPEAMSIELLTAKSSAVNLLFPDAKENDYVERPIPEQFISRIVNGKVVTEPVVHAG
ncbi:adenylate cyclase associated N terminal-domain-containing protein [Thamnocephalis sphaerospora]|uniref:Adenylyl cyclase-associated protein n=1 Tax=Thamnocephalis sphaerospora TaxID=78915 RepID=A0A4P9XS89_9FUNG|nr:adenylate cyclase associated N terminal-domain-containing protein [Thamnocephalis sphaerospora]|eukprot:RKP08975.1 adenylate cyclase associated N terminal-domain-containing protein [Thamnocephalis sphaerospora]